ncbi:MAG: hypothetical protein LBQ52_00480 [Helicobacteraceae bacterium]|jgi:hypothetical protein|nr:hypothetical protein [Helicobacteraceae bacterium]
MRFTESQRVAKRNSLILTAIFTLGVICVVFFVWYVSIEIWRLAESERLIFDPIKLFTRTPVHITFLVVFATLGAIVLAVDYTNSKYKGDGSAVAEA